MKYDLAIFDLDGTLLDTLDDLTCSVNHAMAQCGYPQRTRDEVCSGVGDGLQTLLQRMMPADAPEGALADVLDEYLAYYSVHMMDHTEPFAGIPEILVRLRTLGVRTALVSNKTDASVQPMAAHYFPGAFESVTGSHSRLRQKPYPDLILETLRKLDVPMERAVYIGDSEVDIQTAANAGMDLIVVEWGYRDHAFLEANGAKVYAGRPADLEQLICGS